MDKKYEVAIVVCGGAIGGLVSVMEAWGEPSSFPISVAKLFALFVIPFVKGGLAAGIGVYVLTSLDTNHMAKAFFFSVACGLTFPSILTKSGSMVDSVTSQVAFQSQNENALIISKAITKGETSNGIDVATIKDAAEKIIIAEPKIQNKENTNANIALNEAITILGEKATDGDKKAVNAIYDIGLLSSENNLRAPTKGVLRELETIKNSTNVNEGIRSHAVWAAAMLKRDNEMM